MFKVNNRARRRSGAFIVNFEHISYLVLVFLVNLEQVNAGGESCSTMLEGKL